MIRGHERAARRTARATALAASLVAAIAGCKQPTIGAPAESGQSAGAPRIELARATVDATGHVVAELSVRRGAQGLATVEDVKALQPLFTLAVLSVHPVDGIAAWESLLLTGSQTIPSLPPAGPGTPAGQVLTNVKQPGAEGGGTWAGADGAFTYTFANALPAGYAAAGTHRVGVWLLGNATEDGTSTLDFRPDGGTPAPRDTVLYESCRTCHESLVSPRGAVGVRICTTCHTWQNADPDTGDPAALWPALPAVNPNPLDFGRLVHRIHRGKELPTLYTSNSTAPAPVLPPPAGTYLPYPFNPPRSGVAPRNKPVLGRKYSVVGPMGHEVVFGQVIARYASDPAWPTVKISNVDVALPMPSAAGGVFPRDLRDCGVCHQGAPQGAEVLHAVSRRTCAGCHPDVWFGTDPITDVSHFAHAGQPQATDAECRGCHVAPTATQPKVWAPIAEIHVPPHRAPRFDRPVLEIVAVDGLLPDTAPVVRFKLYDQWGPISPPGSPAQAAGTGLLASPIPRAMASLSINVVGPTRPGYTGVPITGPALATLLALGADAQGVFTATFVNKLPATATGTWAVGMEGRRREPGTTADQSLLTDTRGILYDAATQRFLWPYTGEYFQATESPVNPVVYVDTSTGTWRPDAPGAAVPRRTVVSQARCERCHDYIPLHGTLRNQVEYCVMCHNPTRTDWAQRPKLAPAPAAANVNLAATFDGIEERTIDMKVMIHRIHTGGREGSASLQGIEPFVVYGNGNTPWWFDEGIFPGDLRNCTTCHAGQSYRIESVPEDAPWVVANETRTVRHQGTRDHAAGEPSIAPVTGACIGCHATGFTERHAADHTVDGVEQCASCHTRGAYSVDVAHGLAREGAPLVSASFSSLVQNVLVPRCASAACHGGSPPAAFPRLDAEGAYDAIVGVDSQQASGVRLVEPFEPDASYLLLKMRGDAASVGGVATPMPIGDALLDPSELAAFEAWIANGAPND